MWPMTSATIVTVCENGSVHQSAGSDQLPSPSVSRCVLRSIRRRVACGDSRHLRERMPGAIWTHGLARGAFVAFAAVARRGVDVVRLRLAMIRFPFRGPGCWSGPAGCSTHSAGPLRLSVVPKGLSPVVHLCKTIVPCIVNIGLTNVQSKSTDGPTAQVEPADHDQCPTVGADGRCDRRLG
jgi:hypothetical protein